MIVNTSNKSRTTQKKSMVLVKPSTGPSSLIQAAAFAAGGRIATPSTAASLFKAAQSKNAVHIRPNGVSQSSTINNVKSLAVTNTTGLQSASLHFSRPAITMAVQPPENAVSSSASCVRHGGQQEQGCSQGVANNPPNTISHEMAERKDDIDISAIDVDEILAADIKYADEMELDDLMADEPQTDLLNLVKHATEDNDAEANVVKQKDIPSDAKTTENKALEVHDNGDNTLVEKGTASFNGEVGNTSPMEKLDSQNHISNQEQLTGVEIMADEVKNGCNEANQHALPEDTASGSKRHATDDLMFLIQEHAYTETLLICTNVLLVEGSRVGREEEEEVGGHVGGEGVPREQVGGGGGVAERGGQCVAYDLGDVGGAAERAGAGDPLRLDREEEVGRELGLLRHCLRRQAAPFPGKARPALDRKLLIQQAALPATTHYRRDGTVERPMITPLYPHGLHGLLPVRVRCHHRHPARRLPPRPH
ncbi:hypothetical protein GW17_00015917 [Ensete ventricosum]|nr:hypothetical protein GW17_00015917 [Ensete ventricosum]